MARRLRSATSPGAPAAARAAPGVSIIRVATIHAARAPSGRFRRKIERQPAVTVRNAPASGPTRLDTPQIELKRPWIRARSSIE